MKKLSNQVRGMLIQAIIAVVFLTAGMAPVWAEENSGNIKIKEVDYYLENIHPSYWDEGVMAKTSLFLNVYLYIDDLKAKIDTIQNIVLCDNQGSVWKLNPKDYCNLELGYLGGSTRLYDVKMSQNASLLSIKDWKVILELKDGGKVERVFSIPAPGESQPNAKNEFAYTEKFRGAIGAGYIPALSLAKVSSKEYKNNHFKFTFSVKDRRVVNGSIVFLDKNKRYLGETVLFINGYTKENVDFVNDGQTFSNDGQTNTVHLLPADLRLEGKQKISKIKYLQVCLIDGGQFKNNQEQSNFYYQSLSELIPVK